MHARDFDMDKHLTGATVSDIQIKVCSTYLTIKCENNCTLYIK